MTKEYHQFFDTKKKGSYNISEIDKKIEGSIKKLLGMRLTFQIKKYLTKLYFGAL